MSEIWKNVLGYEDFYEVSNLGRLRSKDHYVKCKGGKTRLVKGIVKSLCVNRRGYVITTLSKPGHKSWTVTLHQLVAQAFLPSFIKGTEVNHIDGNKQNNAITNLEVSNPSHNQFHAVREGLIPKQGKSKYRNVSFIKNASPTAKQWAGSIRHAGKSSFGWKTFWTEEDAAKYVDELLDSIGDTNRLRNFP